LLLPPRSSASRSTTALLPMGRPVELFSRGVTWCFVPTLPDRNTWPRSPGHAESDIDVAIEDAYHGGNYRQGG